MYLYDDMQLGETNGAVTNNRLSVIEVTSIVGVLISASLLAISVWNTLRYEKQKRGEEVVRWPPS